jgi:hypothetical protein
MMKNKEAKKELSMEEGIEALLAIFDKATKPVVKQEPVKKAAPVKEFTYQGGELIEIDGKKLATGKKKRVGARGPKNDAGKDALKEIFEPVVEILAKSVFTHSKEGLVARETEADYTFKVTKAKAPKYEALAEGETMSKDFSVRGKEKNSAPKFAKGILAALEKSEAEMSIIEARCSGIVLHMDGDEFTIKISKKRARVGFEAERGEAYEK